MVTIHRIFSSFLRTHTFPAFSDEDHLVNQWIEEKRSINFLESDDAEPDKKRPRLIKPVEGDAYGVLNKDAFPGQTKPHKIIFHTAKPSNTLRDAWGSSNNIPQTFGIHFPYVDALSKMDKETVPRVIERHFLRCLHHNTESCLTAFSDVCTAWKTSLCQTQWGQQISHLARVIEIGLPAQGRIFPIVSDNCYYGSFLSGGGLSVAHGKTLYRPDPYSTCVSEISSYQEKGSIVSELLECIVSVNADEDDLEVFRRAANTSVRALSKALRSDIGSFNGEIREQIVKIVHRLPIHKPYLVSNAPNMVWMMKGIMSGVEPDPTYPMYPSELFTQDIFHLYLSAFGASPPSPNLPGTKAMTLARKLPDKFMGVIGIRYVDVAQAKLDWVQALSSGEILNGPSNLSARYEHSTLSGVDAKELWFSNVFEMSKWYREAKSVGVDVAKPVAESEDYVKVATEGDAFDFSGF